MAADTIGSYIQALLEGSKFRLANYAPDGDVCQSEMDQFLEQQIEHIY